MFFTSASIGLLYSSTVFFHGSNDLPAMSEVTFISDKSLPDIFCFIYIGYISLCYLEIKSSVTYQVLITVFLKYESVI